MRNTGKIALLIAAASFLAGVLLVPAVSAADPGAAAAKKKGKGKRGKRKPKPIIGTLSKRGYTVIALAKSNAATTRRVKRRRFKLRPPASRVTLHLRAPNGKYAGPIVLRGRSGAKRKKGRKSAKKGGRRAKAGKRVIVGVKAGARLGKVVIKRRAGYALAKTAVRWMDRRSVATARKGVPIGAGNFGRVRVKKLRGREPDRDRDGVPASLDIDNDGDLVLDNIDAAERAEAKRSAATASAVISEGALGARTALDVGPSRIGPQPLLAQKPPVVNANAPGLTEEQIQSALRDGGILTIRADDTLESAELDCGSLVYCSPGGTGRVEPNYEANGLTLNTVGFPACCDPDGNGFGTLIGHGAAEQFGVTLQTHAGADQIRTGDLLIARGKVPDLARDLPNSFVPFAGQQVELTHNLDTVFATTAAIASYTDELGVNHPVSYPSFADNSNPLPAMDGPDPGSDVSVTLNVWRPQRRPVPGELPPGAGNWVDVGGLDYWVNRGWQCPQSAYSNVGPGLTLSTITHPSPTGPEPTARVTDLAPDQAANPANTISFTLNLSQCLAFDPGQRASVTLWASIPLENFPASQEIGSTYFFENQP